MELFTFQITKAIVVTVEAEDENEARKRTLSEIEDGEYSQSFDLAIPDLALMFHEEIEPPVDYGEPGYVIYIKDQDNPELWERSEELPGVYANRLEAVTAITEFSDLANDNGFLYPASDFKIVEKFIPPKE